MCVQKPIKRFELVEMQVTAAVGKINFLDNPNLRNQIDQNIVIRNITVYLPSVMANSPTGSGLATSPVSELQKAVLTLFVKGEQSIYRIPLLQFNRMAGGDAYNIEPQPFDDLQNVDWSKSYVEFATLPTIAPAYSILLGVEYLKITPQARN